jgi:hypothetical protein
MIAEALELRVADFERVNVETRSHPAGSFDE